MSYNFIQNISLGNPEQAGTVHPISIENSRLLERTIQQRKRLAILLPVKYYSAYWASVISVFHRIHNKYNDEVNIGKYDYGQKILINDSAIASFSSLTPDGNLSVETSDATITINKSFHGSLRSIDTKKPLSKTQKVMKALSEASAVQNPIDDILHINSMGDTSFFREKSYFVGRGVSSREFFETRNLNGTSIDNIINIGSINASGEEVPFRSGQKTDFNLLVSSSLQAFASYFREDRENRKGSLVIDGLSHIKKDVNTFVYMMERNWLPVTVFCDHSDIESLELLEKQHFKFWHWSGKLLENHNKNHQRHSYFKSLGDAIEKNSALSLTEKICSFPQLSDIIDQLKRVDDEITDDSILLRSEFSKLFGLAVNVSRLIFVPDSEYVAKFNEKIDRIEDQLKRHSIFINQNAMESLELCIAYLREIIANPNAFIDHKIKSIMDEIRESEIKKFYFLVQRADDIEETREFWMKNNDSSVDIEAVSVTDLLNDSAYDHYLGKNVGLIVSGWMNRTNMQKIIFQQTAFSNISLHLYDYEHEWYQYFIEYWKGLMKKYTTSENLLDEMDIEMKDIEPSFLTQISTITSAKKTADIFQFETRVNSYANARYTSDNSPLRTKKIQFAADYFMYSTETHRFFVVNEDKFEKTHEMSVDDRLRDNLHPGDKILLSSSGVDLLTDKADELMQEGNTFGSREKSKIWKKALMAKLISLDYNMSELRSELSENGCDMNIITLKNWIFEDSSIGPQDDHNIDIIAKVCSDDNLKSNLNEVKKSIKTVRSFHQKAAFAIKRDFIDNLSSIFHDQSHEEISERDMLSVSLDEYGEIIIIRIMDIEQDPINIDPLHVNRLIHGVE